MSQGNRSDDDDLRDALSRLEREFQAREQPPDDSPYRMPSSESSYNGMPGAAAPAQQVRLAMPLSRPIAVYVLLAINVIMYGLTLVLGSQIGSSDEALYVLGAKWNPAINDGQLWRLLTPMVLHGGIPHLLFNSWALYVLGTEAERVYGTARFLAVYLIAGLAGSIASYAFNPEALSVGASGAIFGLFGALGVFSLASRSLIGREATKMQLTQMATLIAINLGFGFLPGTNIDNSAHIGGLIAGTLVSFGLAPRYAIERRFGAPSIERRGSPLLGWGAAGIVLIVLVGLFWLARSAELAGARS